MVDRQKAMPWFVENTLGFMIGLPVGWVKISQLIPKAELFVSIWSILGIFCVCVLHKGLRTHPTKGFQGPNLWNLPMCFEGPSVNGHNSGSDSLEVPIPYISGLFFRPKFQGISPQFIWPNIWLRYYLPPICWILEISH